LPLTACLAGETHTTIPTAELTPPPVCAEETEEAPDDIVVTPGGLAYRANVHHQGEENPWPPVKSTRTTLKHWFSEINVRYRDHIETRAGETRTNIFQVSREGGLHGSRMNLYATNIPPGIELTQYMDGGLIGTLGAILIITLAQDIEPGQYSFEIGLKINRWDYGTVPCTIEVVE
jgi:hypothetical protein